MQLSGRFHLCSRCQVPLSLPTHSETGREQKPEGVEAALLHSWGSLALVFASAFLFIAFLVWCWGRHCCPHTTGLLALAGTQEGTALPAEWLCE